MKFDPIGSIKTFWENSRHILSISYKPGMQHFQKTLKIVAVGTLLVGLLGYIISLIISLII